MILPKRLKKGDTIGVIAPSGHLREVNIDDVKKSLIEIFEEYPKMLNSKKVRKLLLCR